MTNFYPDKISRKRFVTPENAVLFIPVISSLLLSLTVALTFIIPQFIKISDKKSTIKFLNEKVSLIPLYKQKSKEVKKIKTNALKQQGRLLNLVAGEKELKTVLNKINEIAIEEKISIMEVEPIFDIKQTQRSGGKVLQIKDNLLQPSVEKYSTNLIVNGNFQSILNLLRKIEMLETFIITDDMEIDSKNNSNQDTKIRMKIKLSAYGKKDIAVINHQKKR